MISYGKQHLVMMDYISFDISQESHHRNVRELSDQVISHEHSHIAVTHKDFFSLMQPKFPVEFLWKLRIDKFPGVETIQLNPSKCAGSLNVHDLKLYFLFTLRITASLDIMVSQIPHDRPVRNSFLKKNGLPEIGNLYLFKCLKYRHLEMAHNLLSFQFKI